MTKKLARWSVITLSLLLLLKANAEPTVIAVTKPIYPVAPFLQLLPGLSNVKQPSIQDMLASSKQPLSVAVTLNQISTPSMTPGDVIAHSVSLPQLTQPIFIVGSDTRSQEWLQKYHDRLSTLGAVGFLVQANNAADIQQMQALIPNLVLLPLSGSAISQQLQLHHYPVLISNHLIEQ